MTVAAGANAKVWLDGFDMSGFFREFAINADKMIHDATTFGNNGSRAKQVGVKHGMATGMAFSDSTVNTGSWAILSTRYGSGVSGLYVWLPHGVAIGAMALSLYSEEVTFNPVNMIEDLIKITVNAEAKEDAVDIGVLLHANTPETVFPFNGTPVDNLVATTNGGVGSAHVFDIAGAAPNAVIRIQHSVTGAVWVDLIVFPAFTSVNSFARAELASGTTVNRHLRMTITDGGTTTSVSGGVLFSRR